MDNEIWKPVYHKIFNNKYLISNLGRVKNINTGNLIKGGIAGGYYSVVLNQKVNDKLMNKNFKIHILVAKSFIINSDPKNKIYVNHKDGNKFNNKCENLEWVTPSENCLHAKKNGLQNNFIKKIGQYNDNYELIAVFNSMKEASQKTNTNYTNIHGACNNLRKKAGGFVWKYMDNNNNKIDENILTNKKYFKNIKDFDNYFVTKDGKIFNSHTKKYLRQSITEDGYLCVNLRKIQNGKIIKKKKILIHREVATAFIPNPNNYDIVNHKNLKKNDNNINNLEWVTSSQNTIHYHVSKGKLINFE